MLRTTLKRLTTVEEVVENPAEYVKLDGFEKGLVPWWPDPPQGVKPDIADPDQEHCLHEIAPDRWVGVFRSEYAASHPSRVPDLQYRREDL